MSRYIALLYRVYYRDKLDKTYYRPGAVDSYNPVYQCWDKVLKAAPFGCDVR
ncbi:MAG: hypothetical protein KME64_00835 [Scytonematopsis contorta HA4267-MV1]|jgi:hypothetical protein|nr:hypothetical protein [Scytonematopsis contorta HA4267-MV1]